MKRAFKMKSKAFFIIFKGLSLKQIGPILEKRVASGREMKGTFERAEDMLVKCCRHFSHCCRQYVEHL